MALPVLIAAFVVTSIWLFRARTNVGIVRPGLRHKRAAGWAWGGWVTPVVSLWFPFQVVRDTARIEGGRSLVPFLGAWWTVWLVALTSGQIGPRLTLAGPVGEGEAQFLGPIETFNAVFVVVALVLWVKIVRAVNADQEGMFQAGPARPLTA